MSESGRRTSTSRVRRHRQQVRDAGNMRLEVTIGSDVVSDIRALAAKRGRPLWEIVEAALMGYVSGNTKSPLQGPGFPGSIKK